MQRTLGPLRALLRAGKKAGCPKEKKHFFVASMC